MRRLSVVLVLMALVQVVTGIAIGGGLGHGGEGARGMARMTADAMAANLTQEDLARVWPEHALTRVPVTREEILDRMGRPGELDGSMAFVVLGTSGCIGVALLACAAWVWRADRPAQQQLSGVHP